MRTLSPARCRHTAAAHMRGMSLVELMVGIAVSLFVVAAAALLVSSNLSENRRLLLETQLQQDLRATADIITRELRRSGFWANALSTVPTPSGGGTVVNPMTVTTASGGNASTVYYRYSRSSGVAAFGFRLDADGVIRACQSDGTDAGGVCASGWQELTDPNTIRVTTFSVMPTRAGLRARPDNANPLKLPCTQLCADGSTDCWPTVTTQEYAVSITAQSKSDASVVRTLNSSVRLRNDRVLLSTQAPTGQSCPAS